MAFLYISMTTIAVLFVPKLLLLSSSDEKTGLSKVQQQNATEVQVSSRAKGSSVSRIEGAGPVSARR